MWIVANNRGRKFSLTLNTEFVKWFSVERVGPPTLHTYGLLNDISPGYTVAAITQNGQHGIAFYPGDDSKDAAYACLNRIHDAIQRGDRLIDLRKDTQSPG